MRGDVAKKGWDEMAKALFYFVSERNKTSATDILQGRKTHLSDTARATLVLTSDTKVDLLLGRPHAFQVILKGSMNTM